MGARARPRHPEFGRWAQSGNGRCALRKSSLSKNNFRHYGFTWRFAMHSISMAVPMGRLSPGSIIRSIVSILFGLLLLTAAAFAQVETGQISGTVSDESGAVVPNAGVIVRNTASNAQRNTISSPSG